MKKYEILQIKNSWISQKLLFVSKKGERCDLILWSFDCFRWIDFSPRQAFYGQENCNLSLYKSTRISLTNAILYSQSPVYLQQLRRLQRGRILNFTEMKLGLWSLKFRYLSETQYAGKTYKNCKNFQRVLCRVKGQAQNTILFKS